MTNQEHTALINTLNDIKKELAGIRMEIENLRESNIGLAEEETKEKLQEDESFWLERVSDFDLRTKYIQCAYCGKEFQSLDGFVPSQCPGCERKMREV